MNKSFLNLVIGLAGGALIGAAAALLLAPETGEETRKIIKDKFDDLNEKTKEQMDKMKEKMDEMQTKGKEKMDEMQAKGKAKADEIKDKMKKD